MNLTLVRREFRQDGIFGVLSSDDGILHLYTLEHAYEAGDNDGDFVAKVPEGVYTCVRGPHRLDGMASDFETFEVIGVPGHQGILVHQGNWNADSHGCILVGSFVSQSDRGQMIRDSAQAFKQFMAAQFGCDTFQLRVQTLAEKIS